jgi:hypothetical protein
MAVMQAQRPGGVWRGAIPAVLALLLAACQPLPHPFEPETKGINPLLQLKEGLGVTVMPVAGVPTALGYRLSTAIAAAFRDAEIPAAVEVGNRGSFVVMGSAKTIAASRLEETLEIEWDVAAPSGQLLGNYVQQERLPLGQSAGPTPAHLAEIAQRGVAQLVGLVRDDMPVARMTEGIAIGAIDGAPGDGGDSLRNAFEFVLRQSGIPVARPEHGEAVTLVGAVEVTPPADGKQKVAIRWVLLMPDGSEIGDVKQENAVPAGSLDHHWGNTALLVAEAAYDGIISLYEKLPGNNPQ